MSRQLIGQLGITLAVCMLGLVAGPALCAPESSSNTSGLESGLSLAKVAASWARHGKSPWISMTTVNESFPKDEAASSSCENSLIFELPGVNPDLAIRSTNGVTDIYATVPTAGGVVKYSVDSMLNCSADTLGIVIGPWVVEDLDLDGDVELVGQYSDHLRILSSPTWNVRADFEFPGMNVVMTARTVNVDSDDYPEIFFTPNGLLDGYSLAVVVDYDPLADSFYIASAIEAPIGTVGRQAIGDFDNDGRMEFIVGNDFGYGLFEWLNASLVYIGGVGSAGEGNTFTASSVRPGPCGEPRALLGYSSPVVYEHHYELMKAVGDNLFETVHVFAETTGWTGVQPNLGADVDCDGLDELTMAIPPYQEVWDWDSETSEFVLQCSDLGEGPGAFAGVFSLDLDRNGASEWAGVTSGGDFHVWKQSPCEACESAGVCTPSPPCGCESHADPSDDGISADIVDVVLTIGVAFRAASAETDPAPCCPFAETDLDCDGTTNVVDVVKMIEIAFRSAVWSTTVCRPCL